MKIEYNILWLDDAKKEIEEGEYNLELYEFVKSLGFKPRIDITRTEDEFFGLLNTAEWDLILTDYNLDEINENPEKGDEVIEKIRSKDVQTEILFYTKKDDEKRKQGFDRITFVDTSKITGTIHNEKVLDKAKELIELTVRKFQNIVAMRGMIMHETSDLDVTIQEILKTIIESGNKDIILNVIKKKKTKSTNEFLKKKIDQFESLDDFLVNIGADHRLRGLIRNLPDNEYKSKLETYQEEIINIRNQFAHATLDIESNIFKTKGGKEFDEHLCKQIRIDIIEHKENLDNLKIELGK